MERKSVQSAHPWMAWTVAGLLLSGAGAQAAPYAGAAYEGFDYGTANDAANDTNDGDISGNTGGTGWGGAWTPGVTTTNISSGTLSYPGITGVGNRLTFDASIANATQNQFRNIGQSVDSGSLYFSFLTRRNNTTLRTFNFGLFTGTTEKFAVGQVGTASTSSNGNFAMLFLNNGTIVPAASPIAVDTGVTHLVVGRVDFDASGLNERVRIYIDPSATGAEPGTAYLDGISPGDLGAIDTVRPFAGNNAGTPNSYTAVSADFDEIRIGGTYASVLPAVPEPSVLGVAGVGALGMLRSRRRRR